MPSVFYFYFYNNLCKRWWSARLGECVCVYIYIYIKWDCKQTQNQYQKKKKKERRISRRRKNRRGKERMKTHCKPLWVFCEYFYFYLQLLILHLELGAEDNAPVRQSKPVDVYGQVTETRHEQLTSSSPHTSNWQWGNVQRRCVCRDVRVVHGIEVEPRSQSTVADEPHAPTKRVQWEGPEVSSKGTWHELVVLYTAP